MAWNHRKTTSFFIGTLVCTILFAISAIILMAVIILKADKKKVFIGAFIYIVGVLFINGIGCIWFKIVKNRLLWTHAITHTIALVLMIIGDFEMFGLLFGGKINDLLRRYILSLFSLIVYLIEYFLSYHLIVFHPGTTASKAAFRSGVHAFGGALTFFICAMDSFVVWRRVSWEELGNQGFLLVLVFVLQFSFACTIWYLLLNPYFDWRRLKTMAEKKKSRSPSRSSSRSRM